jgi:hypothetical protein
MNENKNTQNARSVNDPIAHAMDDDYEQNGNIDQVRLLI